MSTSTKVSMKDILTEMAAIRGIASEIVKLAPVITTAEKDIIRLQEMDERQEEKIKGLQDGQTSLVNKFDEAQKTNQKILIAIGVVAILTNLLGPILFNRLFQ